jgi:O-antigen/teichoic acid export membrane protein
LDPCAAPEESGKAGKETARLSRRKATGWYLAFLYINYALLLTKGVLLVPLYLRYMNPKLYGAWLACGGIVAYFGMLEFGFNRVLIQRVAESEGGSDGPQTARLVGVGIRVGMVLSALPLIVGLVLSGYVPVWLLQQGPDSEQLRTAFIVASLAASLMMLSFTPASVLQGLQRQMVTNMCHTGGMGLGVIVTVYLLYRGYGLASIPMGSVVHYLLAAVGAYSYLWFIAGKDLLAKGLTFDRAEFRSMIRSCSRLFAGNAARTITDQSDRPAIGFLFNPLLCNVFVFTGTSYKMLVVLVGYVSHAVMPSLAHLGGEKDAEKLKGVVSLLIRLSLMFGALFLGGALVLNEEFLHVWVGAEYYGGDTLNILMFFAAMIALTLVFLDNILVALGEFSRTAAAGILEAAIYLPVMLGAGYLWGLPGFAAAAILAKGCGNLVVRVPAVLRRLGLGFGDLARAAGPLLWIMAAPICLGLLMKHLWNPSGIGGFILFGALYVSTSTILYGLLDGGFRELGLKAMSSVFARITA